MTEEQEKQYNGLTHQIGDEFIAVRRRYNLMEEMTQWRTAHPTGTVKQFVDHLVQHKLAIRLDTHPGFVFKHFGW